jgi:hypothetical protein
MRCEREPGEQQYRYVVASVSFAWMGLALLVFAAHLLACGCAGREVQVAAGVEWSHVTVETLLAWLAMIMVRMTWSYLAYRAALDRSAAVGSTRSRNKGVPVRPLSP